MAVPGCLQPAWISRPLVVYRHPDYLPGMTFTMPAIAYIAAGHVAHHRRIVEG